MFADALNSIFGRLYLAVRREDGQTFVEYAMIGVVIAVGLAVILGTLHTQIHDALNQIQADV